MKLDKSYKVRVTPEQSRKIQELAFQLGFEWYFSGKQILHTEISNLTLNITCMILGCFEDNKILYADTRFTEISADDLITLLTNLSKPDTEIDTSANSVDKPKFKVGDKVYCPSMLDGHIYIVRDNKAIYLSLFVINDHEDCYHFDADGSNEYNNPIAYHATEENRQALQVLHPDIEFEQPPKELTGDDLAKAMLERGDRYLIADCGDGDVQVIYQYEDGYFYNTDGNGYLDIKPIDPRTGKPLTQAVLDE